MARVIVILFWALALSLPVSAQQSSGAACISIADDAERLACYDAIFMAGEPAEVGDEVRIASEQMIPARPTGREPAEMILSCVAGALDLRFAFANQLLSGTSDNAPVTFQVDLGGNTVRNLPVGPDNTTIGFANARDAAAFLDTLEGARNLKVRITPVRQRSLVVDFRVGAHIDAIGALRGSCR